MTRNAAWLWHGIATTVLLLTVWLFAVVKPFSVERYRNSDIGAIREEGQRICRGENPYSRIHIEGFRTIEKPPIYLPGFYLFGCGLTLAGFDTFSEWITAWRTVNIGLFIVLGALLYLIPASAGQPAVGVAMMLAWFFGRWGSLGMYTLQTNFAGMIPLLLALWWLDRAPRLALLLFGLSLAMKQVAIFIFPLFLIWRWHSVEAPHRPRATLAALGWITLIPLLLSLLFLLDDMSGFVQSILYSALRSKPGSMPTPLLRNWLLADGVYVSPLMVMGAALLLVYLSALRREISRTAAAAAVMLCFVSLNGTFFRQYLLWFLILVPLVFVEQPRTQSAR